MTETAAGKPLPVQGRQRALTEELASLVDVVEPAPLLNLLLERAFELQATDLHFDPQPNGLAIRLRLDGVMHDIFRLPQQMSSQAVSRMKLLAGMNITEKRLVQDGHISSNVLQKERDVRVCVGPTIYGERLVMRLMPDATQLTRLEELGMDDAQVGQVRRALANPYGVVLSVGPVGTGKSTTTYGCLHALNQPSRSLVTIEDPVERRVAGVNQIQVDPKLQFGFTEALRGVLRQDADVIMIGEIRDAETAHIAVRAGLTGIRVLSTLHASDTGATIDLFREFNIPRMFIADAINCLIAQRLMRKVCEHHRENYTPDATEQKLLRLNEAPGKQTSLTRGVPHDTNFHSGYFGRTGIFEVMYFTEEIREMITSGKT
ncbi:MAG: type II/IV secretion system protein, partial [Planctomycetaceae bacterium]|nr:type II/IV secretion system protein [Planctomycetaceae bacterium]